MNIPDNVESGNTYIEMHIGHVGNIVGDDAVEKDYYYINGEKVTKEEYKMAKREKSLKSGQNEKLR